MRALCVAVAATALGLVPAPAQTNGGDETVAVFRVRHDHAVGSGDGELRITATGVEYRGEGEDEAGHSRVWRDDDIKRIEFKADEIEIAVYEADRVPVVPGKLPGVGDTVTIPAGTEREYQFDLREGEVRPETVRAVLARFKRPVGTSVLPADPDESGRLLFEIPVFHRHVTGGESGMLRVYERHVVFEASVPGHSQHWRYSDIRDIARLGRYKFEIATYEEKRFTDGKSYVFDLKRPMEQAEYDALWKRLYAP